MAGDRETGVTAEPLTGLPLLRVGGPHPTVVAADVHVGLGAPTPQSPRPEAGSPEALADGILEGTRRAGADRVLLLGDVKETIQGAPRHVRTELGVFFGRLLSAGVGVEVVLGNHDVGLPRWLPPEVQLHPASGLLRDRVGYFHGHAWPSNLILRRSRTLVAGHLHPGFRLAPSAGRTTTGKERVWVRTVFPPLSVAEKRRRRRHPLPRAGSMIVLPAYNPLCANESLNREEPKRGHQFLVKRFLARGESRAYLLDGTDLGPILWLPGAPARALAAAEPRSG